MTGSDRDQSEPRGLHNGSEPSRPARDRRTLVKTDTPSHVDDEIEKTVGITVDALASLFVLSGIRGFGPQKFRELHLSGLSPTDIVTGNKLLPTKGKRGDTLRAQLELNIDKLRPICRERAVRQILAANKHRATILTYGHADYPRNVFNSSNPVPLLYVRGSLESLRNSPMVACVGSRGIRPPYVQLHESFARTACRLGYVIVSGFAVGADAIGHRAALSAEGQTTCVMPCGLDRPFPPEHKSLWEEVLHYHGASLVSEFAFGTAASALTLRKRNKLIVSLALGVLVSQSSATGGAMNAYRFAVEQHKPVATFAQDNTPDTSGNALIASDHKTRTITFPTTELTDAAYEQWLQALSSST